MFQFDKNRIVLISGNDGTDARIGKVCRSLSKMGFELHYVGWDRCPDADKPVDLGSAHLHIIRNVTPHGRFTVSGFIRFARHVVNKLREIRPNTVCCVDEEYSLLAMPMRFLFYRFLVCDVMDALYDRHSHRNWPMRTALRVLSFINRLGANRLIATDEARFEKFGRFKSKCTVVGNYPEDPGEDVAKTLLDGPTRIYAAGSMSVPRGLKQLIAAVDATTDVEIISAGWLYDDYAKEVFAKHPSVSFRGIVSLSESLQLAAQCDAVFAFYEPHSVNNRMASPTKLYDALSVGRPVIINEEAEVSEWVADNEVGFRLPYADTEGLKQVLASLKEHRQKLPQFAQHARWSFRQGYSWEAMEPRLRQLYTSLC